MGLIEGEAPKTFEEVSSCPTTGLALQGRQCSSLDLGVDMKLSSNQSDCRKDCHREIGRAVDRTIEFDVLVTTTACKAEHPNWWPVHGKRRKAIF